MKKPRDARDAKKSEDLEKEPLGVDGSQQPAELQVGEEEASERPDRFEPDPRAEPPAKENLDRNGS